MSHGREGGWLRRGAILAAQRIVKTGRKCGHFREQAYEPLAGPAAFAATVCRATEACKKGASTAHCLRHLPEQMIDGVHDINRDHVLLVCCGALEGAQLAV